MAEEMIGAWSEFGAALNVALLTGAPGLTAGTWDTDLSAIELDSTGYARQSIQLTDFSAPSGNNPVTVVSEVDLTFGPATDGDWDQVTHVALVQSIGGDAILSVIPLATPITVTQGTQLVVAAGDLQLLVGSA
jgi:hypothetical protein